MARSFDAITSAGTVPAKPREKQVLLNLPAQPPWEYMHHPARWMYVPSTGEVLPDLGKLKHIPGVSGVDKNGSTVLARVSAERRGWTVLPWDILGDPYIRRHEGKHGPVHLPRWLQPKQIGSRCHTDPSAEQMETYYQFLRDLMEAGHIPPPDETVLEGMVDLQRTRHERILQRIGDQHPQKVAREAAKLEELQENLAASAPLKAAGAGRPYKGHRITGARGSYQVDGKGTKHRILKDARAAIDKL